jgi:protoheme IX farnesyltransferase
MKVDTTSPQTPSLALTRTGDFFQLVRPRLALLVLFTVAAGWLLATDDDLDWVPLLHALIGTALLFSGASGLNQLLEQRSDALMRRTENRPLPAERLHPFEVFVFGCVLSAGGLGYLLAARQPIAVGLGAFALVSYLLIYTPLKRQTPLNTLIGAIPGGVPPLIGWTAARGRLDSGALVLFLIVYLWQIPHFLAIAWIYRDEYARAGLRMLPVFDPDGLQTGRQMVRYTVVLILVSLLPFVLGLGSCISGLAALVLGMVFLHSTVSFAGKATTDEARHVFRISLLYLPALFLLFVLDALLVNGTWL